MEEHISMSETVWIAEAYHGQRRVERVVHKHEQDARHDIETLMDGQNARIEIEEEPVLIGHEAIDK